MIFRQIIYCTVIAVALGGSTHGADIGHAKTMADKAANKATELKNQAFAAAHDTADSASAKASELTDKAKAALGIPEPTLVDKVKHALGMEPTLAEKAADMANSAMASAQETASLKATELKDSAKSALGLEPSLGQKVKSALGLEPSLAHKAAAMADEAIASGQEYASIKASHLKEMALSAIGFGEPTLSQKAQTALGLDSPSLAHRAAQMADEAIASGQEYASMKASELKDMTSSLLGFTEPTMSDKVKHALGMEPTLAEKAAHMADQAKESAQDLSKMSATEIKEQFKNSLGLEEPTMTQKVKSALGFEPTMAERADALIDQAIASGRDAVDSASVKASEMKAQAKSAMGIEEPTVMDKVKSALGMEPTMAEKAAHLADEAIASAKDSAKVKAEELKAKVHAAMN